MTPALSARRLALVALGALLLAGGTALAASGGGAAPSPAIESPANTSGYLQPTGADARRAYVHHDVDVGVAVADNVAQLDARLDSRAFERALAADADRTERLGTIREYVGRLETETEAVRRAQREARAAYLDGDRSRAAVLQDLARLDARAESLERLRTTIESRTARLNPVPLSALTTVQNVEATLETVGGPATERVRNRYAGSLPPGATYLSVVGSDGLVVATVGDEQLYRDALDESEWDPTGEDGFAVDGEPEISVALRRAAELYPWAFANGGAAEPLRGYGDTAVYRITAEHTQGRLSAYLDGATQDVFRELQRTRLAAVPVTDTVRAENASLRVVANVTHPTGPLEVHVTDAEGDPVDARVTIDGNTVGVTGSDGQLWTIQPAEPATLRAVTDAGDAVDFEVGGP